MVFKLYVDSRFRQETGGVSSDTQFAIELPSPMQVKGKAFVDTVLCPNVFYVIRAGVNDRIHVKERVSGSDVYRIATIVEGQYRTDTLKDAVLHALQTGRQITGNYTVRYLPVENRIVVGNLDQSDSFAIYPAGWLKLNAATWNAAASNTQQVVASDLRDSGSVTGFAGAHILSAAAGVANQEIFAADAVNLQPYSQLFLRSSLGEGFSSYGPDGSTDIIRRIVVGQTPLNGVIVDQHGLPYDSVPVGQREITSLAFKLTDSEGRTVDTHGHHISFSIIFIHDDE